MVVIVTPSAIPGLTLPRRLPCRPPAQTSLLKHEASCHDPQAPYRCMFCRMCFATKLGRDVHEVSVQWRGWGGGFALVAHRECARLLCRGVFVVDMFPWHPASSRCATTLFATPPPPPPPPPLSFLAQAQHSRGERRLTCVGLDGCEFEGSEDFEKVVNHEYALHNLLGL